MEKMSHVIAAGRFVLRRCSYRTTGLVSSPLNDMGDSVVGIARGGGGGGSGDAGKRIAGRVERRSPPSWQFRVGVVTRENGRALGS